MDAEQLYLFDKTTANSYRAVRGWNGTPAAAQGLGATVAAVGNIVAVNGSDAIYRDFEVLDSNPTRIYKTTGDPSVRRGGDGLFVYGPRVKLVNLLVHDNQDGIFMAVSAAGAEAYGCLVYNNGHSDPARGEGHGLYLQNQDSSQPKRITDSVFFSNFAVGAKAYGETSPCIGVEFAGNISFNNGAPASFPGNPSGFSTYYRQPNLFVGNGSVRPDYISVTNNYLYDPPGAMVGGSLRVSYVTSGGNNLVVKDNYVAGGHQSISVAPETPSLLPSLRAARERTRLWL
ncbi:MAG: hypothetical protein DMG07_27675 [Acidobacteria bacterium]|nr:MAG: hypothetical protein DMG07_27675 [Acidobacteriota bacterium]